MPKNTDRPVAFSCSSENNNGALVFRDWESGMILPNFTGLYVYYSVDWDWLMRTWIDKSSGERVVEVVRRWEGYLETVHAK